MDNSPTPAPTIDNNHNLEKFDGLDSDGVATLLAILQSKTNVEAAKKLGISAQALWVRTKKYKIDEMIKEFPKQAALRLQLGSTKAADTLVEALDEKDNKMEAATQILDRVGLIGNKGIVNIDNKILVMPTSLYDKYGISSDTGDSSKGQS